MPAALEVEPAVDRSSVVEDHPHRLGDEQRVARRSDMEAPRVDRVDGRPREGRRQLGRVSLIEAVQPNALEARNRRHGRTWMRSHAEQEDQREAAGEPDELVDHPGARGIEPLQVVDDDDPRAGHLDQAGGVTDRERAHRLGDAGWLDRDQSGLLFPTRERRVAGDRGDGPGPQPGEARRRIRREQEAASHRPRVGSVLFGDSLGEGACPAVWLASAVRDVVDPRPGVAGGAGVVRQIGHQPRLADAGLAFDDERAAGPAPDEHLAQSSALGVPTDEPPDGWAPRLEAGLPEEPRDPDRPRLAAQDLGPAILDLEALPRGPHGRLVEKDLARLGQRLDPGSRGHCRARQGPVEAARDAPWRGHDLTGRQADPDLERFCRRGLVDDGERGPDRQGAMRRSQRIVVVSDGPAEDGEDGIADELLTCSVEGLDRLAHRRKGKIDPRPNVLEIVLRDETDIIDEVGEQGGDDPTIADLDPAGLLRRIRDGATGALQPTPALVAEPRPRPGHGATRAATHSVAVLPSPRPSSFPPARSLTRVHPVSTQRFQAKVTFRRSALPLGAGSVS